MKNFTRRYKRTFTLIEIIVVVAILALTASAIGINIYQAVEGTRFTASVDSLKDKFASAWELARLARVQVKVCVKKTGDDYLAYIDSEMLPTQKNVKHWWAKPQKLEGIKSIVLEHSSGERHEEFTIIVDPAGMVRTQDRIKITSRLTNESPLTISPVSFTYFESQEELKKQSSDLYPKDLTDKIEAEKIEAEKTVPAR
jgi:prepilin-type N-terminal cleavage/methylation domain-containing protein